jgi:heparin/heparan-sulfate lyase
MILRRKFIKISTVSATGLAITGQRFTGIPLDSYVKSRADGLTYDTVIPDLPDFNYVLRNINPTHPRIFLNQNILATIREKGLSSDQENWLTELKKRVDNYPEPPELDEKLRSAILNDNSINYYNNDLPRIDMGHWGTYSAHAALAWLLTDNKKYYKKALDFLNYAAGIFNLVVENNRFPFGHAWPRLAALSAYDWLYNDLPQVDREKTGKLLFKSLEGLYQTWKKAGGGGEGGLSYVDNMLGWYLSIVYLGAGYSGVSEDSLIEMLREQYALYGSILRQRASGKDGVDLFGAIGYTSQLLQTEINFIDSWRTAIGGNFFRYIPNRIYLSNYFLWNTIHNKPLRLTFGWSDSYHTNNGMDIYSGPFLTRVKDLISDIGDGIDIEGLEEISQFQVKPGYKGFMDLYSHLTSASPLYFETKELPESKINSIMKRLPRARFFPDPVGQLFMNSGWTENDTYAMFIAGRQSYYRKHYDENHFTIYKKGFLALDSGARPAGQEHEINYYYDTIAHNCVLIHLQGEKFSGARGPLSVANTGGMNKNHGAQVKAFETNEHFTYIASDATTCYNENKAEEVIRQFIFIYPDYFIVFDRVTSKSHDQKKTWLLHTQHEPQIDNDIFSAVHRNGKIFVRTLMPQDFHSEKIGGPGKEFWADGRNWPIEGDYNKKRTPDQHLFGCYRMEISSDNANKKELFLHLIEVGDKHELTKMTLSRFINKRNKAGIEFDTRETTVRILFNRDGEVGGNIRITRGSKTIIKQKLTNQVLEQQGLALKSL